MSTDKRSVHTDALHTLGTIIGEGEKRDAIHIAVEPCIAHHALAPGDHVGKMSDDKTFGKTTKTVGIVDPFLTKAVLPGERFWLLIYPREITSLRHVWAHPEFPNAEVASFAEETGENFENHKDDVVPAAIVSVRKIESEKWLRNFCGKSDCPSYETVMEVIMSDDGVQLADPDVYGKSYHDGDYIHFSGLDAHEKIPPEFWDHVEVVTGKKFFVRASHFSCSC